MPMIRRVLSGLSILASRVLTRENVFAMVLCIVLILLVIVTAESAPQWIYQNF